MKTGIQQPGDTKELPAPAVGERVFVTVLTTIFVVFSLIAVANLIFFNHVSIVGVIASILWLLFACIQTYAWISDADGRDSSFFSFLEVYSSNHFVQVIHDRSDVLVCIGFRLLGKTVYYCKVPENSIVSLYWRFGQATSMSGRDMKDWSLWLRYEVPEGTSPSPYPDFNDKQIQSIGPPRAKEQTEALGTELAAFLMNNGVRLVRGEQENEFVRP